MGEKYNNAVKVNEKLNQNQQTQVQTQTQEKETK